jgi:hypothetical protein
VLLVPLFLVSKGFADSHLPRCCFVKTAATFILTRHLHTPLSIPFVDFSDQTLFRRLYEPYRFLSQQLSLYGNGHRSLSQGLSLPVYRLPYWEERSFATLDARNTMPHEDNPLILTLNWSDGAASWQDNVNGRPDEKRDTTPDSSWNQDFFRLIDRSSPKEVQRLLKLGIALVETYHHISLYATSLLVGRPTF